MSNVKLIMCDTIGGDIRSGHCNSLEKSETTNVEDIKPICEEIMTIKTEVIEECYDYETLSGVESEDVKPFSTSERFQSITDPDISPHKQISKDDCCEQHIVWCKEENDFGLSEEDVARNADKKYVCDKCIYITKYKSNFRRHAFLHSDKKQFKCETCGTLFRQKDGLRNHAKTHEERTRLNVKLLKCMYKTCMCEQQCHCDPCQFETAYGNSMRRHVLAKHGERAERYACTACPYSTHFEGYLRDHMRLHAMKDSPNKYKCGYCDYTTHLKGSLTKHIPIHTNDKKFKCTYINCKCNCVKGEEPCDCEPCDYQTVHQSALKGHILRKHTGDAKKYICAHCGYVTNFRQSLKRHLSRIHTNVRSVSPENP